MLLYPSFGNIGPASTNLVFFAVKPGLENIPQETMRTVVESNQTAVSETGSKMRQAHEYIQEAHSTSVLLQLDIRFSKSYCTWPRQILLFSS